MATRFTTPLIAELLLLCKENAAALFHQEEAKIVTFRMAADQPPSAPKICEYVAAVVTIHPTLRSGQTIRCHGGFGWDEQQALEGLHKVLAEKVAGVLHGCLLMRELEVGHHVLSCQEGGRLHIAQPYVHLPDFILTSSQLPFGRLISQATFPILPISDYHKDYGTFHMPPRARLNAPTITDLMLLCKENAEWLLAKENLRIVFTRIGNMVDLPYVAVVVKSGDPSVKIMSEPCLTELEALRELFEDLGKQVGTKLKEEGDRYECYKTWLAYMLIRCKDREGVWI